MRSAFIALAVLFALVVACSNDSGSGGLPCCTITVSGMTSCICTNTKGDCTIKNASATACIFACKGQPDLQGTPRMTCGDAGGM